MIFMKIHDFFDVRKSMQKVDIKWCFFPLEKNTIFPCFSLFSVFCRNGSLLGSQKGPQKGPFWDLFRCFLAHRVCVGRWGPQAPPTHPYTMPFRYGGHLRTMEGRKIRHYLGLFWGVSWVRIGHFPQNDWAQPNHSGKVAG